MENNTNELKTKTLPNQRLRTWAISFISGLLVVGVIAAYYYGDTNYLNSAHDSTVTAAWSVILLVTSVVLGLAVGVGIPYLCNKEHGLRAFVKTVFMEAILLTIAIVISGFFFFPSSDNCVTNPNNQNCGNSIDEGND
jgi:hypothetical protein